MQGGCVLYNIKHAVEIKNPSREGAFGARDASPATNGMALDRVTGSLYAATSNGCVYMYDCTTFQCLGEMHTADTHQSKMLLSVAAIPHSHAIATGGEDGIVRLWDVQSCKLIGPVEHANNTASASSTAELSFSWVNSIDADAAENWMAFCGGSADG